MFNLVKEKPNQAMKKIVTLNLLILLFLTVNSQDKENIFKPSVSSGLYQSVSYFGYFKERSGKLNGLKYSIGFRTDLLFVNRFNLHLGIDYMHDKERRYEYDADYSFFSQQGDIEISDETNILNIPVWLGIKVLNTDKIRLMGNLGLDNHMYVRKRTYTPIDFSESPITENKDDISDLYGTLSFSARYLLTENIYVELIPFFKLDFYKDFIVENYQTGALVGIGYKWSK